VEDAGLGLGGLSSTVSPERTERTSARPACGSGGGGGEAIAVIYIGDVRFACVSFVWVG